MYKYLVYLSREAENEEELEVKDTVHDIGKILIESLVDGGGKVVDEIYDEIPEKHVLDKQEIESDKKLNKEKLEKIFDDECKIIDFYKKEE